MSVASRKLAHRLKVGGACIPGSIRVPRVARRRIAECHLDLTPIAVRFYRSTD